MSLRHVSFTDSDRKFSTHKIGIPQQRGRRRADRAPVYKGEAVNLNLLQMVQVAGKNEFNIAGGLGEYLMQIRGVLGNQRSRGFELRSVGFRLPVDTQVGED